MIKKSTLKFLSSLKKNNNRDWFEKNKADYLTAKSDMEQMVRKLLIEMSKKEKALARLDPSKCMFRIYRDVRFSKDKRPYKHNLSAGINPGGKNAEGPGYYVHIEPGNSFIAGGTWLPEPPKLAAIRQEIDYNSKKFLQIINAAPFKRFFGKLSEDEKLKTAPKGYPKDHPQLEYLKLKSFLVWHKLNDSAITSTSCVKKIASAAAAMIPLNNFIREAMD